MPRSAAAFRQRNQDFGECLYFTISALQKAYETNATAAYAPGAGPLTAGAWVKWLASSVSGANPRTIISKGHATGTNNLCWSLAWNGLGQIRVDLSSNGSSQSSLLTTNTYADTERWHHVAFVYNQPNCTIYVDGVSAATTGAAPVSLFASTMPVCIGGQMGAVGTVTFPGSGLISDAFVTTQALNANQILQIMEAGATKGIVTPNGQTTSVWQLIDTWLTGTSSADTGTANSPLTLSGVNTEWYGRMRPRMGFNNLNLAPMFVPVAQNVSLINDPTNGWNNVARATDVPLVAWTTQANSGAITVGRKLWYYSCYASIAGAGLPAGQQDMAAGNPQAAGAVIVGYDNEGWTNTPVAEQNNVGVYASFASDAIARGFEFAAIPSFQFLTSTTNSAASYALIPGAKYLLIQTQQYDWSVDTFAANVFPPLRQIRLANPTINIIIQTQGSVPQNPKGADQFDLSQCVQNAHNFLIGQGFQQGITYWGNFANATLFSSWTNMRKFLRPGNRGTATSLTLFAGQVSSASYGTLQDTAQTWTVNQWTNRKVYLGGGLGASISAVIASNTVNQLTIVGSFSVIPNYTTAYHIGT